MKNKYKVAVCDYSLDTAHVYQADIETEEGHPVRVTVYGKSERAALMLANRIVREVLNKKRPTPWRVEDES